MHSAQLATRLRMLRARERLTLRQAAELAGLRVGTISEAERGITRPQPGTLAKLAEVYGADLEELLGLEEPLPLGEAPAGGVGERRLARVLEPARKALLREGEGERPQSYIVDPAEIEVAARFLAEFSADERGEGYAQLALRYVRAEEEVKSLRDALRERQKDIARLLKAEEDAEAGRFEWSVPGSMTIEEIHARLEELRQEKSARDEEENALYELLRQKEEQMSRRSER
jgi:transcriptional regulator with XRE-family HTH domain